MKETEYDQLDASIMCLATLDVGMGMGMGMGMGR